VHVSRLRQSLEREQRESAMALPKLLSNRYEIKTRLSKTGMSEVYQAYDTRMGCDVAVKVMLDLPDPKAR